MGQSGRVPSQVTFDPQVGLPGSVAGAGLQVPSEPGRLQRSQLPLHGLSQQVPSAQNVDVHCELEVQASPRFFRTTHEPAPSQKRPTAHWRWVVHVVGQVPLIPSHT